ncbi:MAG: putative 3-methyladenine glycosylase [Parcubacteria group bacterium]|nr:putative 3-methyladenine glycosylase [Parcubacteria group bacterium]
MSLLPSSFFEQKTLTAARALVGKTLVRKIGDKTVRDSITEVEAYVGPHDLASHSSKGRTARTEVMHGKPGTIYVYLIYGMYWMLNIVTEEKDFPAAILIRSTEKVKGPGRVAREFGIDKNLNGKKLGRASGLWIEDAPPVPSSKILRTPRIGVDYAGAWKDKPYRFVLKKD